MLFNEKGIQAIDGTEAHPSISFISDPTTGFASDGASDITVSLAGTKVAVFSHADNQFLPLPGTASHPGIGFVGDRDTGFSNNGSGTIRVSSLGTQVAEFNPNGMKTITTSGGALNDVLTSANIGSLFTTNFSPTGYIILPGGLIVQWGSAVISAGASTVTVSMAYSWPNGFIQNYATQNASSAPVAVGSATAGANSLTLSRVGTTGNITVNWLAIGH